MSKFFLSTFFLFISISQVHACHFWISIGDDVKASAIEEQLLYQPNSLKNLGLDCKDGWSLSFYDKVNAVVKRSAVSSAIDKGFDEAVKQIAYADTDIVLAHLRKTSSGCEGVENPHPFKRVINGRTWLFGHNGEVEKNVLIDLIGNKYLLHNPPEICTDNVPDSWIDSELYFIYLLKNIEEAKGDVEKGIAKAMRILYKSISQEKHSFNFFLSDGISVWAFKKGSPLFYNYSERYRDTFIASSLPEEVLGDWSPVPEGVIIAVKKNKFPEFFSLSDAGSAKDDK